MKQTEIKAKIVKNSPVVKNYFQATILAPQIARAASPGQFVNIKVAEGPEPLLRRPLSIHSVKGPSLELFYEVLGQGTKILSQRKPGEFLDIIGPLGNGFDISKTTHKPRIIIAGGMGVAPLAFLAEQLTGIKTLVLIGAKTKVEILCEKEFKKLGCDVKIATDDGSYGFKGRVTDLLKKELATKSQSHPSTSLGTGKVTRLYACGPRPMLKEISRISREQKIPAQISLEEHMACGIGACLGCVVNTNNGYKRVCKDGPVLNAEEIIW